MDFEQVVSTIDVPFSALILGASGSGKTVMVRALIQLLAKKFSWGCVVSPTAEASGDFAFLPSDMIFNELKPEWYAKVIEYQKQQMANGKKKNAFIIIDDLLGSDTDGYGDALKQLFSSGRHFGLTPILLCQSIKNISPVVRMNANFVFIFRFNGMKAVQDLFDEVSEGFKNRHEFLAYLENNVSNYHFLFINRRGKDTGKNAIKVVKPLPYPEQPFQLKF